LLGALAAERGAGLVASEKQPHRARLVARALEPCPVVGVRSAAPAASSRPLRPHAAHPPARPAHSAKRA
ncbi:hypothetical protein ACWCYO_39245, partial [Kitasatospora sp. NPDC001683]